MNTPVTTIRGFQSPMTSTDDESEVSFRRTGNAAIMEDSPAAGRKNRKKRASSRKPAIDDVSANCSPSLRPAPSPSMSGISLLRNNLDKISLSPLDPSSRTSTMSTVRRVPSFPVRGAHGLALSRTGSTDGSPQYGSDISESGSNTYEIQLQNEFVSQDLEDENITMYDAQGQEVKPEKVSAKDFEPLRCLGKGAFGTVFLVKQKSTGRLFAQKQFKKASLVVHKHLVEQTKTERQILESISRHPFVVKLFYAFQDQDKLYLILEYGQGGELFHHLSTERMFSEEVAAFYMAEMILAITHLHSNMGVVYRDLKPENCLLDSEGHLLLTDFGLSKVSVDEDECNSMLGTADYMAPEVILGKKYGKAVDWWSLGALGVDLMTGSPPFRGANNAKIQQNILKQKLQLPYYLSADAKDLLTRLLRRDPKKRLGANMPKDLETIKKHRFFRKIDWKKLEAREVEPPIQPLITDPELAENFSSEFTDLALSPRNSFADDGTGDYERGHHRTDSTSSYVAAPGIDINVASGRSVAEDPFHGFSFVAPSSLLENERFIALGS